MIRCGRQRACTLFPAALRYFYIAVWRQNGSGPISYNDDARARLRAAVSWGGGFAIGKSQLMPVETSPCGRSRKRLCVREKRGKVRESHIRDRFFREEWVIVACTTTRTMGSHLPVPGGDTGVRAAGRSFFGMWSGAIQ